jgi:hypothetical protein
MKSARKPSEAGQETPSKRKHNDETLFDGAPPLHLLLPSAPRTHPRPSFARLPHCASRELEADLQTTRSRPPLHQPASRRGRHPTPRARAPTPGGHGATFRAISFPKVTKPICRLPSPALLYRPEFLQLEDLLRFAVRHAEIRRAASPRFSGAGSITASCVCGRTHRTELYGALFPPFSLLSA